MRHILFVCNHNAGRSQMAQAFFERHGPLDIRAQSAGTNPAAEIWPTVIQVMAEVDIEIGHRKPRKLVLEDQLHADRAITMGCGDVCPYVPTTVDDWDLPDPAALDLDGVRELRDEIERRVISLLDTHLDDIYTDRTAHQLQLQRLLPDLEAEFATTHAGDEIRACADQELEKFADATVRSHVLTFARRNTADCLRSGACRA